MAYSVNIDDHFFQSITTDFSSYHLANTRLENVPPAYSSLLQSMKEQLNDQENVYSPHHLRHYQQDTRYPKYGTVNYHCSSSSQFLQYANSKLFTQLPNINSSDIYPIAVRYTNNSNIWVIERPPFQATITYRRTRSGSSSEKFSTYRIWMPWTVMILDVNFSSSYYSAWLFFNDKPLESMDETVIPCFFPNMYVDGRLCLNQTSTNLQIHLARTNSFDIATVYNYLINDYMSGGWNLDLGVQVYNHFLASPTTTPALKDMRAAIFNGKPELKIKPSISPVTGRLSSSKQVSNLLSYTQSLSLDQMMQVVTEAKSLISSRFSLSTILTQSISTKDAPDFTSLFYGYSKNHYRGVVSSYTTLISPNLYQAINANSYISVEFSRSLIQFLYKNNLDQISQIEFSDDYFQTSNYSENPILVISDLDVFDLIKFSDSLPESFTKELVNVSN